MDINEEFKGIWDVFFTNGGKTRVEIVRVIIEYSGRPIILETKDGRFYNWQHIRLIKKV